MRAGQITPCEANYIIKPNTNLNLTDAKDATEDFVIRNL